uniref:Uncharacterized protein n=1 Tax=Rhizophora mucronata TaxID=61149 RepID=A0A2P2LHK8_RHIMU
MRVCARLRGSASNCVYRCRENKLGRSCFLATAKY